MKKSKVALNAGQASAEAALNAPSGWLLLVESTLPCCVGLACLGWASLVGLGSPGV